ncbi:hypothetical protein ASPSYDRAFT_43325 [Aspergillus sydowii CBS 593.65]|uniref:Secreted protein n=1 Tax=Aspergillus sydowii CBS 593.65 TaxID=1036612 RepID=A0A1L9TPM6_9EURO|nr:uncharacterized protein ASPSYDRAFT_43325 [Aspergillus sydowii CBS 593.65]OJJ61377.1 hypothetical protein ASPSYDRAFT_43325 [Aspergillus sydowii CBS 593.65]
MKLMLFGASWLALAAATPIDPSAAAAPTPASATTATESTTVTAAASQTTVEVSKTPKAELGNLCSGGADNSQSDSGLSLGKLEECAGNTLGDKPVSGLLSGVGGLLGGGKKDE